MKFASPDTGFRHTWAGPTGPLMDRFSAYGRNRPEAGIRWRSRCIHSSAPDAGRPLPAVSLRPHPVSASPRSSNPSPSPQQDTRKIQESSRRISRRSRGNRSNNRLSNLRDVSQAMNIQNERKPRSNNKSGFLGVKANRGLWKAEISIDGKTKFLGRFKTPEEAHQVYVEAKRKLHPGCTL